MGTFNRDKCLIFRICLFKGTAMSVFSMLILLISPHYLRNCHLMTWWLLLISFSGNRFVVIESLMRMSVWVYSLLYTSENIFNFRNVSHLSLMDVLLFFRFSMKKSWSLVTLSMELLFFLWLSWLSDSWLIVSTLFVLFISSMFSSISFRLMALSKLFASVITVFIESRDCKVLSPGNFRCS